ncbi:MAG TPA: Gfo/Idh/MocA family oxidoreductase [Candidatus Binataceae bacterium]|nr:Gfo/Idh/MocA family oxidoreductase [Candidatus Binataceae bacterium]
MRLRGAISGFGEVAAQAHLAGWASRPDVSIVAIHDPVSARRHLAINLLKNARVYDDLELMLDGEALDFLDIASPPAFHGGAARLALEAGVNVLVEKPICLDAREFRELAAIAASNRRVLSCVHNWKHAPAYRRAHELISSGRLGRIDHISLVRMRNQPAGDGIGRAGERWRLDPKTGGGILVDHSWHTFYLGEWLMGGEMPAAVSAHLGFAADSAVDDVADLRIEFPEARLAHVHLSWRAPVRRTLATISGSEALLEIDGDKILLTDRSGVVENHSVHDAPDDSYHAGWFAGVAADFEQSISGGPGGEAAVQNLHEAEAALALTIAARQSAAENGRTIKLNPPR